MAHRNALGLEEFRLQHLAPQKLENLMPNLEAKFWTIATAIWTTVTAFWKLEDTHPKKSVLEVLKLGPKKKIFQNGQKKNLED